MQILLPIPYPRIKDKDDHQVVEWLLKRVDWATSEFLYGRCYPIFKSLHNRFYSDSPELLDFIHNIYVDIIEPRKKSEKCKLQTFSYKSTLYTWMGVVSIRFCYAKYKVSIQLINLDDSDRNSDIPISKPTINDIFDREDLEKILDMMTNDRYRQIIRLHYLDGLSNEETAQKLGMDLPNYYNKHRLAKVQFVKALKKEGLV